VGASERVLLRHPGNAERLAREASQQNIVIRNLLWHHFRDVTGERVFVVGKIRPIRLARVLIPFAGKHAFAAGGFKSKPHAADPSEEIYDGEPDSVIIKA
jgi:hypothetical protein